MISTVISVFAILISVFGLIFILMLQSSLKSKEMLKEINDLIKGKTMDQFETKDLSNMYFVIKRIIDVLFSIIILILVFPIFSIVTILTKLDTKGPIFIKQKRIGKNERTIYVYKFRTSRNPNKDENIPKEYSKVGLFLYKTSISELPMIINVIKGDMSLVGISPYYRDIPYELPNEIKRKIFSHKPGIVSLWAISLDKQKFNLETRPYFDLYYQSKLSLWLDIVIMIRTIEIAFAVTTEY